MRKTFPQARPPDDPHEITFTGYYQLAPPRPDDADDGWEPPTEWVETIHFLPRGVFSATGQVISSIAMNNDGDMTLNQLDLVRFLINAAVPGDDRYRMSALVDDPYRGLANEQATAAVMSLVEEYSGKGGTTPRT